MEIKKKINFGDDFFFEKKKSSFFHHKNTPKLMILEVPQPWEYYRTLRDIETLLPSLGVVKFHGLGLDL